MIQTHLVRFGPLLRPGHDSDSCRCGPDTQEIRRPMHGMIRRPVPVRAVKTRQRFGSETASFHVSVRSYVFTVIGMLYMLILSFHVLVVCHCWLRPSFDIPLDCNLTRSIDWID